MGSYNESFFIVYLIVILVAIFAGILWIFLPFAVFGTKAKLDAIIAEAKQTNAYLKVLVEQQKLILSKPLPSAQKV